MKLRLAKKICKAMAQNDYTGGKQYTGWQKNQAVDRVQKTKSSKDAHKFFDALMRELGVEGRAEVLAGTGATDMAFSLLMRENW
jgi:hypothetical protein